MYLVTRATRPDSPSSASSSALPSLNSLTYSLSYSSTSSFTTSGSSIPDLKPLTDSAESNSDKSYYSDSDADDINPTDESLACAIGLPPLGIATDVSWSQISFCLRTVICSLSHIYYLSYAQQELYFDCIHIKEEGLCYHPCIQDLKGPKKAEGIFHCLASRLQSILYTQVEHTGRITNTRALRTLNRLTTRVFVKMQAFNTCWNLNGELSEEQVLGTSFHS